MTRRWATGDFTRAFEIDPSGKFVNALSFGEGAFSDEYLSVSSLSQSTGMLSSVQKFDMTPGTDPEQAKIRHREELPTMRDLRRRFGRG